MDWISGEVVLSVMVRQRRTALGIKTAFRCDNGGLENCVALKNASRGLRMGLTFGNRYQDEFVPRTNAAGFEEE
jgi:hypothetical protein